MLNALRALLDVTILVGLALAAMASASGLLGRYSSAFDLVNHFQIWFLIGAVGAFSASFIWPFYYPSFKKIGRIILLLPLFTSLFFLVPEVYRHSASSGPDEAEIESGTLSALKLMSFNIYIGTWDGDRLSRDIATHGPDVVTLQEYAPNRFRNQKALKTQFPYQARCSSWRQCTLAILSKYPLDEIRHYDLGRDMRGNPFHGKMIAATVRVKGRVPLRVYSIHLSWPLPFGPKEAQMAEAARIIRDEAKRYSQQVLAGDFNATGWSFATQDFVRNTGLEKRSHFLLTFPSPHSRIKGLMMPAFLSLDHMLMSPSLASSPVERGRVSFGDHSPILSTVYLPAR